MLRSSLAILGATFLLVSEAFAQSAPAPQRLEAHPVVEVNAFASTLHAQGPRLAHRAAPNLLRRAMAQGDVRDWIAVDDPAIQMLRDTSTRGYVELIFDIGADGRVRNCRVQTNTPTPYSNGLCERLSPAMRFQPALDLEGHRTSDIWYVALSFWQARGPARARIVNLPPIPPTPVPNDQWPPFNAPVSTSATGLELLPGGGTAESAASSPWAGVEARSSQGAMTCNVINSSGDRDFNARACESALGAQYVFPDAAPEYRRLALIHFAQYDGRPMAILPVQATEKRAQTLPTEQAAIRRALSAAGDTKKIALLLEIDARGQATQCLVFTSSGTDEADVAACRLAVTGVRFSPALDVFGRPHISHVVIDE